MLLIRNTGSLQSQDDNSHVDMQRRHKVAKAFALSSTLKSLENIEKDHAHIPSTIDKHLDEFDIKSIFDLDVELATLERCGLYEIRCTSNNKSSKCGDVIHTDEERKRKKPDEEELSAEVDEIVKLGVEEFQLGVEEFHDLTDENESKKRKLVPTISKELKPDDKRTWLKVRPGEWGEVYIRGGPHGGRYGYYTEDSKDDENEMAIIYFDSARVSDGPHQVELTRLRKPPESVG